MKIIHIIITLAVLAMLMPLLTATVKNWGRTLAANSRDQAGRGNSLVMAANNVAALNNPAHFFAAGNNDSPTGQILAANDANFDGTYLSEPLSEYIVDFPDQEGLDVLLEAAAPSIPVGRSFTYRKHDSKEAFQASLNDEDMREIGGEFAQIRLTGTQTNGRTTNKGLTIILDNDQGGEDPVVQQRAVANLRNRLLRTELYRLEALLEANDSSPATPNWGATNTAADPDGDLVSAIDGSGDDRGINANTVLFFGGAWLKRFLSLGLGSNPARFTTRNLTPDQLRELVGVDRLIKSNFRYQSSATAKTKIGGDKVYSYYSKAGAMPDDPSNVKRFITSVPGGGMMRVYVEPVLKRTKISVEHYSTIDCTSTLGIRKIAPTFT